MNLPPSLPSNRGQQERTQMQTLLVLNQTIQWLRNPAGGAIELKAKKKSTFIFLEILVNLIWLVSCWTSTMNNPIVVTNYMLKKINGPIWFSINCHFNTLTFFCLFDWIIYFSCDNILSLSVYFSSWGSSTSAADARWHATAAHSVNRGIGRPIRSSAVSVNGFWHWSLSPSDDPPQPLFEKQGKRGVGRDWSWNAKTHW